MNFETSPFKLFKSLSYDSSPIQFIIKSIQKNSPTTHRSTTTNLKKPNTTSSSVSKNLNQNITSSPTSKIPSKIKLVKNSESLRKRYDKLIAFGDSHTDNGNVYYLTNKQWPSETSYMGRYCDGKVWVEYLAEFLNIELVNYAFGGATVDSNFIQGVTGPNKDKVPGIKQQIEAFISANTKSKQSMNNNPNSDNDFSKTLFALWDSGGDYCFTNMTASPLLLVQSLIDALHLLVQSFPTISTLLIPNLPDFSLVPQFNTMNSVEKEKLSKIVDSHNKYLLEHLIKFGRETGVKIFYLECDKIFVALQTGMNSFGFVNCVDAADDVYGADKKPRNDPKPSLDLGTLNADKIFKIVSSKSSNFDISLKSDHKVKAVYNQPDDKDSYFYFDAYHCSSKVHEFMANVCLKTLENSIYSNSTNKRVSFSARMYGNALITDNANQLALFS
ncbi:gdsl family lipase [Gigaspora margarita]|uniref:Gdsl family lipase n=1 Tax=Gigaspora margarita TaxID=4874 RepID=A0A8H3XFU5_GIGMA|nr:gdsl family lipase [Gigaspora margarita]